MGTCPLTTIDRRALVRRFGDLVPLAKPTATTSNTGGSFRTESACFSSGHSVKNSGNCTENRRVNPDFVDLLRAFVAADVRFLIVGAYALALHGRPRATGDLDVWIEATPDNATRVMQALHGFGAPLSDVTLADFSTPGAVFQIGVPPGRIDILTELTGLTFDEAWRDRQRRPFGDVEVDFIGLAAFLKNKRATGRPKDLGDIEGLE
jgi:hypothetical protein